MPRQPRRFVAWTAAAVLGGLALAGSALALEPPANLSVTPSGLATASPLQVTFSEVTPDAVGDAISYEVGVNGTFSPIAAGGGPVPVSGGPYSIEVRATETGTAPGTATTAPIAGRADLSPPTVTVGLSPSSPQSNGWYNSLTLEVACSDDNPIPGNQCVAPPLTSSPQLNPGVRVSVTDIAGRTGAETSPPFRFDNVRPTTPQAEDLGFFVADQPTFTWLPSSDGDSHVSHYLVLFRIPDPDLDPPFSTIARVNSDGRVGSYSARRDPDLRPAPLPEFQRFEWRVQAVDVAGNVRSTGSFFTTIDPTTPPPPQITGGPSGPTANTSPTFTWQGDSNSFQWKVVQAGTTVPIRTGSGDSDDPRSAQIASLPDGVYSFQVVEVSQAGRQSQQATRSFVVDTTPPSAPLILVRPTFPSVGEAIFTWSTEPGAYSRWSVVDGNGGVVVAPTDTPVTSATLPQLSDGTYTFGLQQIDAAGNLSPATVEAFTVIAPLVPPPSAGGTVTILPKQNARRLKPKAGKTLFSRRPVLRWSRGPRGTKLFNLQIFRVTTARGSRTPKVTKVLSVFPKKRAYRVPKSKTRPKTCYVWRVWPYTGREFTRKPLGVSNYCIASQKVLKKKARIIAQRKAAKARERALLRSRSRR